jgi:malate dehydrogenase (oxaloacetate-decarboxylating)
MAIAAAESLASYAEARGIDRETIIPRMDERDVFPQEAADVAMQAVNEGLARTDLTYEEAFEQAKSDITRARETVELLIDEGIIPQPPQSMLQEALDWTLQQFE